MPRPQAGTRLYGTPEIPLVIELREGQGHMSIDKRRVDFERPVCRGLSALSDLSGELGSFGSEPVDIEGLSETHPVPGLLWIDLGGMLEVPHGSSDRLDLIEG